MFDLPKPVVESPGNLAIPKVRIDYPPESFERWRAAQNPWIQSGFTDTSVWGEYEHLGAKARMGFPNGERRRSYSFPEFHLALLLERLGFTSWRGVQLFQRGRGLHKQPRKGRTDDVKALWPRTLYAWPDDIWKDVEWPVGPRGESGPKNPDIVAFNEARSEWMFFEVKREDRLHPDQLRTLAVLHLLTGASVAVARLVPSGRAKKPTESLPVTLQFSGGIAPNWAHRFIA